MDKSLNWIRKAFNRTIEFKDQNGNAVGDIKFKFFTRHVESELYGKKIMFDVHGFINKEVTILDENHTNLGVIKFGLRANKADVQLENGEKYVWERGNFFMRQWELIHDLPFTDNDPVIINYDRERNFLNEHGKVTLIEVEENAELLTLIGFFIGFYFLRRRRKMAAAAVAAG